MRDTRASFGGGAATTSARRAGSSRFSGRSRRCGSIEREPSTMNWRPLLVVAVVTSLRSQTARADGEAPPAPRSPKEEPFATKPGYSQIFATVMGGTGLRFNNPYRLATPLGGDAESVSRTAAFVDFGL